MRIARLKIEGFRGANSADIQLNPHCVLIGPNNSGKTTIIEALALLLGRDRLVRRLTEHDFYGSDPAEPSRIKIIATVTDFPHNDPAHNQPWFGIEGGVEKWLDPETGILHSDPTNLDWKLAVQIGFAARFDLEELEAETVRFFVDDEATLGDPFAEDAYLHTVHVRALQELGFFLVPASRTWDKWISFSSELFRRVVSTLGGMPAAAVRQERDRLWNPASADRLEGQVGLTEIVGSVNSELKNLLSAAPELQLRVTATDSDSVLESVVPHYHQPAGPTLPTLRQGSGLVSMQSLLLLMQLGKARAEQERSFVLAVEEPELHIQPSQQKRLVNRLNALCDQTICTTHSPTVAAMFAPSEILFIDTKGGVLTARPLIESEPAQPTNHEQHLFYAWRQRLVAALMHDCVLVPEGASDLSWLEAMQTSLETKQAWNVDGPQPTRFGTFVGVVPTTDAKIEDTLRIVQSVHSRPAALLDGDAAGQGYLPSLQQMQPRPRVIVFWPQDWAMEHVVTWIAEANQGVALAALGQVFGETFSALDELTQYLLGKKSYAPTHETAATTLMAIEACRERTGALLSALSDVLTGATPPTGATPLFPQDQALSTADMQVFRMAP